MLCAALCLASTVVTLASSALLVTVALNVKNIVGRESRAIVAPRQRQHVHVREVRDRPRPRRVRIICVDQHRARKERTRSPSLCARASSR